MLRPWNLRLSDRIDGTRSIPVYQQIIQTLVRDIKAGRLASGAFLPSSRELAASLGVNRKTVVLAYEDLIAQGWLESAATRGTRVSRSLPGRFEAASPIFGNGKVGADYAYLSSPDRPLAIPDGPGPKIDEGAPDGRLFPAELLSRAYRSAVYRAARDRRLQYRDPRGSPGLRETIATMLRSERGLAVTAENICITRGSQHGIFLTTQVLARPGDPVGLEELTYEPAAAAFLARGARIVPLGLDEDGLCVDELEQACRRHPVRAVFLTPHHQFPTTIALRPERRLRLLKLARQFGFAIVEDDYDHEFHFDSQPLLPMATYAPDKVIYVGSLSKLLLPALRIGYVAAPSAVIDSLAHLISLSDGMGNTITEEAAAELIESGELRRHARKARRIYAGRRDAFAQSLERHLVGIADYQVPDGGLAYWLRFKDADVLDRIEMGAARSGLRFASSRSFMTRPQAPRGLRFGFASLTEEEADEVLRQFAEIAAGTGEEPRHERRLRQVS